MKRRMGTARAELLLLIGVLKTTLGTTCVFNSQFHSAVLNHLQKALAITFTEAFRE